MKRIPPMRHTRANEKKTEVRIAQYHGKKALLDTWEAQSDEVKAQHHDEIIKLRARVRMIRMLVEHRADPKAHI